MPVRSTIKITRTAVENAKPRDKPYFIWCRELTGFGLRIWPNARKIYYVRYRVTKGHDAKHLYPIGEHGQVTAEDARKLATVELAKAVAGQNPAKQRKEREKATSVKELCERYLDAADKGMVLGKRRRPKAASTIYVDKGRIKHHIIPLLGKKDVSEITPTMVSKFMRDVMDGKTAKVEVSEKKRGKAVVEGGAGTASRTVGLLGGIMSFAISEGIITTNPVRGVIRPADNKKKRRLSPQEYRLLGNALDQASASGMPEEAIKGIRLLLLTGCRLKEIVELKWAEVDEDNLCFRLKFTKEGDSIRPVGKKVFDILDRIPRKEGNPFVLTSNSGEGHYGGLVGIWNRRFRTIPEIADVTPHTFRHSYASVAAECGHADSLISTLIGHANGTMTSQYVHRLTDEVTNAADVTANAVYKYLTTDQPLSDRRSLRFQQEQIDKLFN